MAILTVQPILRDSYLRQGHPTYNEGANTLIYVCGQTGAINRTILSVSYSALPSDAVIVSATLSLYYATKSGNPSGHVLLACPLTGAGEYNWVEGLGTDINRAFDTGGVNWNTYNGANAWATPGGDFLLTYTASSTVPGAVAAWMTWDITAFVTYMHGLGATYVNLLIKETSEAYGSSIYVGFYSKEYSGDYSLRPYLTVVYNSASRELPRVEYPDYLHRRTKIGLSAALLANAYCASIYSGPYVPPIFADTWQCQYVDYHIRKPALTPALMATSFAWADEPRAEAIIVSDWLPRYDDIVPRRTARLSDAIQAGSMFVGDLPRPVTDTQAAWAGQQPDTIPTSPRGQIAAILSGATFYCDIPRAETVTCDKWIGQYPDQYLPRSVLLAAIQSGDTTSGDLPRIIVQNIDKWLPRYETTLPQWKIDLLGAIRAGSAFWVDIPRAETITCDKWLPSYDTIVPSRAKGLIEAIQAGSFATAMRYVTVVLETIRADKWYPTYPDQLLQRRAQTVTNRSEQIFPLHLSTLPAGWDDETAYSGDWSEGTSTGTWTEATSSQPEWRN